MPRSRELLPGIGTAGRGGGDGPSGPPTPRPGRRRRSGTTGTRTTSCPAPGCRRRGPPLSVWETAWSAQWDDGPNNMPQSTLKQGSQKTREMKLSGRINKRKLAGKLVSSLGAIFRIHKNSVFLKKRWTEPYPTLSHISGVTLCCSFRKLVDCCKPPPRICEILLTDRTP